MRWDLAASSMLQMQYPYIPRANSLDFRNISGIQEPPAAVTGVDPSLWGC